MAVALGSLAASPPHLVWLLTRRPPYRDQAALSYGRHAAERILVSLRRVGAREHRHPVAIGGYAIGQLIDGS
jgi:hypothetical protein